MPLRSNSTLEVDQQAHFPTTQPQVSKKLRVMNRLQADDSLQLDNHRVRNNQVHAISTIQPETFVTHRQGPLTDERHSSKGKFVAQTLPISRFQQSWSQFALDLDRAADDRPGDLIDGHH